MVFRGTYDYSLDAKNRLTVPAKFRSSLSGGVVLAQGVEKCVAVWPREAFDAYADAILRDFHPLSLEAEKVKRFFAANTAEVDLDGAGRVMIPGFLMIHAGLEKEVVVTGAGDRLEVWGHDEWAEYNAALAGDIADIRAALSHGG